MGTLSLLEEFEKLGRDPSISSQFPSSHVPVLFVLQRQTWDCGLACVSMVLSLFYRPSPSLESLETLCGTQSVWTIDLAYLLRRCFHAPIILTTTYLGLNPAYKEEKFYAKHMDKDDARVKNSFAQAEKNGISVHQRSVTAIELKFAVSSGRYLVVVLVDKGKLGTLIENTSESMGYIGHFILLHGYDSTTDCYIIKDPAGPFDVGSTSRAAAQQQHDKVSAQQLEVARLAHGTDEDLLFIELPTNITSRHST
jgi:Guanylylate cyclase